MNYLLQNNKRKKGGWRRILPRLFLALLALYALNLVAPSVLGPLGRAAAKPVWTAEEFLKNGLFNAFPSIRSKKALSAEVESLKAALKEAGVAALEREAAVAENRELRKMLSFAEPEELALAADVLSRPSVSLYDTFIISAGTNQGVKEGDAALSPANVALGKVAKANRNTSVVRLFSSPKERTDVVLPDGSVVAAEGRGGGNFEIRLPRELPVEVGREVRLFGFPGKIIGVIESAEADPSDFFQTVRMRTPENIFRTNFVKVLTSSAGYEL